MRQKDSLYKTNLPHCYRANNNPFVLYSLFQHLDLPEHDADRKWRKSGFSNSHFSGKKEMINFFNQAGGIITESIT
jgi:hypothetical protein